MIRNHNLESSDTVASGLSVANKPRLNSMTTYGLNAFNQYQQLENRLTRALGVTLERSPAFRKAFIRKFAAGARLGRNSVIRLQLAEGQRRKEKTNPVSPTSP